MIAPLNISKKWFRIKKDFVIRNNSSFQKKLKSMKISKLSIVIPVFNERDNVLKIIKKIEQTDLGKTEKEIIIIDDCSTDGTRDKLKTIEDRYKVIYQDRNYGKGFALRTGFKHTTGDYVIIQDADLEYDPDDYKIMLQAAENRNANVVYGSRRLKKINNRYSGPFFYLGGVLVTVITNLLYGTKITDEPTCYKMFKKGLLDKIRLDCMRFEFCPEITAKIAKLGEKIIEVPIHYYPRRIDEGKKIRWTDGWQAIMVLIKYRFKK